MQVCVNANPPNLEVDVLKDIMGILAAEEERLKTESGLEEIPKEIPYPNATEKQVITSY
jgi:hypothetical protein